MCNPNDFVTFTVAIINGDQVRVAAGTDPNAGVIFTHTVSEPHWEINYIAFKTGWGSDGKWRLPAVE